MALLRGVRAPAWSRRLWRRYRGSSVLLQSAVIVGAIILTIAVLFYSLLPPPQVRTVFMGRAERMSTIVDFPDIASFRVGGMRALSDSDEGVCVNGLISPVHQVRIIYQRIGQGDVSIDLAFPTRTAEDRRPVAHLTRPDKKTHTLEGPHRLKIDSSCEGDAPTRLAIHGDSEFGLEMALADVRRDYATGYLYSGKLLTYARSVEAPWLLLMHPRLYRIQDADVPAGSRLMAESSEENPPVWWGVARIEPDKPGLSIDASTNSSAIILVLAGGTTGIEKLRIGNAGQITDDPTVIRFFAILSVVFGALGAYAVKKLFKLLEEHWEKTGK